MQAFGAKGFSQDTPLFIAWAGARILRMADGPDEVHWRTVAKIELASACSYLLGRPPLFDVSWSSFVRCQLVLLCLMSAGPPLFDVSLPSFVRSQLVLLSSMRVVVLFLDLWCRSLSFGKWCSSLPSAYGALPSVYAWFSSFDL
jgi:hypothetical protein